jgi:hypothetical protein
MNSYAWAALWLYASRGRRLLHPAFPEAERGIATFLFTIGALVYTASVAVAFLNAYFFLGLQAVLALHYAFDPISRRVMKGGSAEHGKEPAASAPDHTA